MKEWILCVITLGLVGCTAAPKKPPAPVRSSAPTVNLTDTARVKSKLNAQYAEWRGTRYKMGGLSKRGIDCSGFVHLTYRDKLGITIPRSTKLLSKTGKPIKRKDLQTGDLVLFKTGITVRHVGIYMGNNRFLHASTSEGVTVTDLNHVYWSKKYWKARRLEVGKP